MRIDDFIKTGVNNERLTFPKIVRFQGDPEDIVNEIELIGNAEPEQLSGFIRKLARRIKKRIRARRRRRRKAPSRYSISAPEGTATVSPQGVTFTRAGAMPPTAPGFMPSPTAPGGLGEIFKNPVMLMIPAAILMLTLMRKKK